MVPAEEVPADADPVPGPGDAPEPLVILIAAMGPPRIDGTALIQLAGEKGIGQDRRLAPARTEIRAGDGVRLRDAGRFGADPRAVGITAPEAVMDRPHAARHAASTAVLERGDRPAHPVTREHDVAIHQRDEVA